MASEVLSDGFPVLNNDSKGETKPASSSVQQAHRAAALAILKEIKDNAEQGMSKNTLEFAEAYALLSGTIRPTKA